MQSISELMQPFLQGGFMDTITRFVGGSPDATKRTLEAAVPSTMYAIADHGSTESGARSIIEGLRSGAVPSLDVNDVGRVLSDPDASQNLVSSSEGFLGRLFGGRLGSFVDGLASAGGVGRGAASKILAIVAPVALGMISKRVRTDNLSPRGLASLLGDQKASLAHLVPGPMRSLFGGETVEPISRDTYRTHAPAAFQHPRDQQKSVWPWILGGLAALGLIAALASLGKRKPHEPKVAVHTTSVRDAGFVERAEREVVTPPKPMETPMPSPKTIEPVTPPVAVVPKVEEPKVEEPKVEEPKVEEQTVVKEEPSSTYVFLNELKAYFSGSDEEPKRVTIDGLSFNTGKATLNADGKKAADELASFLNGQPKAKVQIEGFTDSTGNEAANKRLSTMRADQLKNYLVGKGIAADRIGTAGHGASDPVASNDDAEGRAQNRRVEIEVEKGT